MSKKPVKSLKKSLRLWGRAKKIAAGFGVKVEVRGSVIALTHETGTGLGGFSTLKEAYAYLCGWDTGRSLYK